MRIGFFFKEAFRALSRSAAPSLAAMLTVLLTALVLGVFIPVVQATTGTANQVRDRVVVDVYVKAGTTDAQRAQLQDALLATPNVKSVKFISKEQAYQQMVVRDRQAFQLLGRNPLPDAFRMVPRDPGGMPSLYFPVKRPEASGLQMVVPSPMSP